MDRATETALINECVSLSEQKLTELAPAPDAVSSERYLDAAVFTRELERIFKSRPLAVGLASALPSPGDYVARDWIDGIPLLLVRGQDRQVRAFLNICSHRGMRVVEHGAGCRKRFSCPYHAWTYDDHGALTGGPQFDLGFGDLDKKTLGLTELPCRVVEGMVFVHPDPAGTIPADIVPRELVADMQWLKLAEHRPFETTRKTWKMNWKTMIEGGAEAYHFNVAHKDSLASFFLGNLSTRVSWGAFTRQVLPKRTMLDSRELPEEEWRIRDMSNLLYSFYPTMSLLVQPDHIAMLHTLPVSPHEMVIEQTTLAPPPADGSDDWSEEEKALYHHNHTLTEYILKEDFDIGETIHSNLQSGLVEQVRFGRFESALIDFHRRYEAEMGW